MHHGRSDRGRSPTPNTIMREVSSSRNFLFIASFIVLFCLIGFVHKAKSDEDYVEPADKEHGPFNCVRLALRGAKQLMKVLSACGRDIKATTANNKEYAEKMGCVLKCVMYRAKLLNEEYLITDKTLAGLINRFAPSSFVANELFVFMNNSCGGVAAKLEPKEENCLTYANYVTCLQASFEGFMNTSPYCIKKKKKKEER